jgi:AraC family transcriptional regulator
MTLFIKNMVCDRCRRVVRESLEALGLTVTRADLGEVDLANSPETVPLDAVRNTLLANGFALLDEPKAVLVEQVKSLIIGEIHGEVPVKPAYRNFSDFLAAQTGQEYSALSHLFSTTVGLTIEKYIIAQKTERVKELLTYGEDSLADIAFRLGYSSAQHLSSQFKQQTGQTPGEYRQHQRRADQPAPRRELDKVGT